MLSLFLMTILVYQEFNGVTSQKLPDNYPLCKEEDPNINDCIWKAGTAVLPLLRDGVPNLGVPPLDPMQVSLIGIEQGQGPIQLNLKLSNISLKGLCDTKLNKPEIELKKYSMRCTGNIPKVTVDAEYEMNGRVLLLPVTGKGPCKLVATSVEGDMTLKGKGITKKNKKYFDINEYILELPSLGKLELQFDNLFNGDKTLGDSINKLLNENWKDMWEVIKPAFEQAVGAVIHQYSRTIFNKVPFNDIFLQ